MQPSKNLKDDFFPSSVLGWTLAPEAVTYIPADLYKYIDGTSELYISYGVEKVITRRYVQDGASEITVDLFDMGSAGNAFGIFAHSQENPSGEVGQDTEYLDGLLRFWQGNYYVSILISPEILIKRQVLLMLGRQIASCLPTGERPRALSILPEKGLVDRSIRYFHHHAWQNAYVFISSDNILEIGPGCEAILAKYVRGEPRPVVLLVRYPDGAAAKHAFSGLSRQYGLQGSGDTVSLKDGRYLAAAIEGKTLTAVWSDTSAAPALELLTELCTKVRGAEK